MRIAAGIGLLMLSACVASEPDEADLRLAVANQCLQSEGRRPATEFQGEAFVWVDREAFIKLNGCMTEAGYPLEAEFPPEEEGNVLVRRIYL